MMASILAIEGWVAKMATREVCKMRERRVVLVASIIDMIISTSVLGVA